MIEKGLFIFITYRVNYPIYNSSFDVLWFIVSDPEFHVIYKNRAEFDKENKREDKKIRLLFRVIGASEWRDKNIHCPVK